VHRMNNEDGPPRGLSSYRSPDTTREALAEQRSVIPIQLKFRSLPVGSLATYILLIDRRKSASSISGMAVSTPMRRSQLCAGTARPTVPAPMALGFQGRCDLRIVLAFRGSHERVRNPEPTQLGTRRPQSRKSVLLHSGLRVDVAMRDCRALVVVS